MRAAATAPSGIVTSNLYINLDAGQLSSYSGSGSTWTDISGNGYNGTLVNSPSYDSGNSGSIVFNGTNNSVNVSAPNPGSLPFSFEFWINPTNTTQKGTIGLYDSAPNTAYVLRGYNSVPSESGVEWWNNNPSLSTPGLATNTWAQVVIVYRFSTNRFIDYYRNGSFVSTAMGSTTSAYAWTNFKLGNLNGSTPFYSGKLAKFAAYTKVLSAAEVLQNFNALKSRYGL